MAQYSARERLIASFLSSAPGIKGVVKKCYILLNYAIYRKKYNFRVLIDDNIINTIEPSVRGDETFFGYYDKSPEYGNLIIFNETGLHTSGKPDARTSLKINLLNLSTNKITTIGETLSYNWQQGCRAQWLDSHRIIYNRFDDGRYVSVLYDIDTASVTRIYDYPVQDAFHDEYFLSINYRRIMKLRPDYGYRNLPAVSNTEMRDLEHDGIRMVDMNSATSRLIISLKDLVELNPRDSFKNASHKVNHIMISPSGKRFIFIHRWYRSGRRFDRLVMSDFQNLTVLSDNDMVSHMCWINDCLLFGYLRHKDRNGFYFIDVTNGNVTTCEPLNGLCNGDGHPSCHGDWIVIDSYPDKSRMQHITMFNWKTGQIKPVLEVAHALRYQGESRCDLHPRFSSDGSKIFFDSVFQGKRRLCFINTINE